MCMSLDLIVTAEYEGLQKETSQRSVHVHMYRGGDTYKREASVVRSQGAMKESSVHRPVFFV